MAAARARGKRERDGLPVPTCPVPAPTCPTALEDGASRDLWRQIAETVEHTRWGRTEEAVRVARRLVEEHDLVPEAHYVLGLALDAAAQDGSAINAYRGAVFLDPGFAHAHWRLALVLAATGQFDMAVSAARWAVRVIANETDVRVKYLSDLDRSDLTQMMEQTLEWS